jgi:hypothetical protein
MDSAADVRARLNTLHEAVWELAAVALVLRDSASVEPGLRDAAESVLLEAGFLVDGPAGVRRAPGLEEAAGADATKLAAQVASGILQSAAVLSGADAWTAQDDDAILAQGVASAQAAQAFKTFALPMLDGLSDLLAEPSPIMLDVGVGVAAMAIAYCEAFPGLRVVGLDVFPRALELARSTVERAGMTHRIELRCQDVATLDDSNVFSLAWLPAPFVPRAAINDGLPRMVAALVPGGWLMVGHGKFNGPRMSDALTRLQTAAFGGTPLTGDEAQSLLRQVGLQQVATLPTPLGAPGITVGRKPPLG